MKKRNVLTALAAAAMVLQLVGATAPASAVDPELDYEFTPTSGPQGTKITVTGTGCPHDATKARDGVFLLTRDGTNGRPVDFVSNAAGEFTVQYDTVNDPPGTYLTFGACLNTGKSGPGDPYTVTEPVGSTYHPIAPVRLLDTRTGLGAGGTVSTVGPNGVIDLKVTDVSGIPAAGVKAVVLNVTVADASGPESHLKIWPTGSPQPETSNLNFTNGVSVPNLVIARVGTGGKVSLRNNVGTVNVIADAQGWYSDEGTAGSRYVPVNPQRILDTREAIGAADAQIGPTGSIEVSVTGVAGVPADATAVVLNMTVDDASGPESYLTVWPAGGPKPTASNLNFTSGPATTNLVVARVGTGGKVAIYNNAGSTDVIGDIQGWFGPPGSTTGSTFFPTNPARILDSRNGTGTPGGVVGQLGEQRTIDLTVVGVGGVPATGVTSVVLNVTVADSPGPESFLTVFPSGTARPFTSNLNFSAFESVPNLVIVRVNNGKVSIYNNAGSTNVIADVQGWFKG